MGKTRNLFKKTGDIKGTFHTRMGTREGINAKDLTETKEIKKRWQEYTELCKRRLNDLDNHDGVVTHPIKWALGNTTMNRVSVGEEFQVSSFKF